MKQPGEILLLACYELGHQPLTLASPLGLFEEAGYHPTAIDLSLEPTRLARRAAKARLVAISVPMHTALRLGAQAAARVRQVNPQAHICFYGHYAWLNADYLLNELADSVIAGEYEQPLLALAQALEAGAEGAGVPGVSLRGRMTEPYLQRLQFAVPRRGSLPPLERYARVAEDGGFRLAGYVEASRGCLHTCLHCPITPVYNGRFFVVPAETVLADIRAQVTAGATHITFGDPDFLNGPGHSLKVVRAMHGEHPALTFDITAKVEHLLQHRALLPELREAGCIFIVSAFESVSDEVLTKLAKGHTRTEMAEALRLTAEADIPVRPSLVAFTPWTTLEDYAAMLDFVRDNGIVEQVDPVQYSIRLLVPPGSALVAQPDSRDWLGELDASRFTYRWTHPDPRMDALHRAVSARVEQAARDLEPATQTFEAICALAYAALGRAAPPPLSATLPRNVPRLTEAWFCCAEPTELQLEPI